MRVKFTIDGPAVAKARGRAALAGKPKLDEDSFALVQSVILRLLDAMKKAVKRKDRAFIVVTPPDKIDLLDDLLWMLVKDAERSYSRPFIYSADNTRKFEAMVRGIAKDIMDKAEQVPIQDPVVCELRIFRKIPKSTPKKNISLMQAGVIVPAMTPDFDNLAKSLTDAMNEVVYADDRQIVDAHIYKRYDDGKGERVEVLVETYRPEVKE